MEKVVFFPLCAGKEVWQETGLPCVIGAGTLLADGIITPPITVTSAIEGLNMVKGLEQHIIPGNDLVLEIVLVILLLLFIFHRFGDKVVGGSFGPFMLIWFIMLGISGTIQIFHYPAIFAAHNSRVRYPAGNRTSKRFLVIGRSISLYYRGRSALFRFRPLRKKEHTGKLDIR